MTDSSPGAVLPVPGYVIGELLGAGGFGEVYRARHELMGRDVAIKILHSRYSSEPQAINRFLSEARAIARLSHPSIVDVFDFGQLPDGRQFCVMELIHGRTLRDVLRERTRLPLAEAMPILRAIAEAIDAAHAAGVAHRDLKPENVFVTDAGAKLIDFGLAKLTGEGVQVTVTGAVFGTPLYMSPEQCRGKALTGATDAYSFGALAYHVLVGEPPFSGDPLELALHHLNDDPEPPSRRTKGLDVRVDRVLLALMSKEPGDRPSSLVDAVAAIAGDAELPAKRRTPIRARWLLAAFAAVAILTIGGALAMRSSGDEEGSTEPGCGDPATKLAGIWDPSVRARAAVRFAAVSRPDVQSSWRVLSAQLDDYAARWSRQWTAACRSEDRTSDRLLYAQRLTCLDKGLVWLRGNSIALAAPDLDVASFAEGYTASGLYVLADCDSTGVLRAQPPAPPATQRDHVERLLADFQVAWAKLRAAINSGRPELVQRGLDRVREVAKQLDALGVPDAAEPYAVLAEILTGLSEDDPSFIAQADQAVALAIQRATELRNDPVLPWTYGAEIALMRLHDVEPAKLDEAMRRWAAAISRAGHPLRWEAHYLSLRIDVELARGDLAAARADAGTFAKLADQLDEPAWQPLVENRILAHIAVVGHQLGEADRLLTANVERASAIWGPAHRITIIQRKDLYQTLFAEHESARARDDLRAIIAANQSTSATPAELIWAWSEIVVQSIELGDTTAADQAIAQIERLSRDGSWVDEAANTAFISGSLEAATYVYDHAGPALARATPLVRGRADSRRSYVAFMKGDDVTSVAAAKRALAAAPDDTIVAASTYPFMAIAEARAGHKEAALAHLPFHAAVAGKPVTAAALPIWRALHGSWGIEGLDEFDLQNAGWVQAAAEQWSAAVVSYRAALELVHSHDWNRAELEAFLGDALVESGDPKSAIAFLEDALAITADCCRGFHYYAPIAELALARALWSIGGDRDRARTLATAARDHFGRLGAHRARDRHTAELWLDSHR